MPKTVKGVSFWDRCNNKLKECSNMSKFKKMYRNIIIERYKVCDKQREITEMTVSDLWCSFLIIFVFLYCPLILTNMEKLLKIMICFCFVYLILIYDVVVLYYVLYCFVKNKGTISYLSVRILHLLLFYFWYSYLLLFNHFHNCIVKLLHCE